MRLNGDFWSNDSSSSDEEKENVRVPMSPPLSPPSLQLKLVVGYALTSKKVKSFLQPKLEGFARKRGILFVEIDQHRALSEQGPFDIVLHKLTGKEWRQILEEFVNHGGVLFKVYIVGETIRVVRRFSLPDINERELLNNVGVFQFPRVSCAAASAEDADLDPGVAELPPGPLLERLARELRRRLGLHLFNIDIIREHGTRDRFYVIDINYFPGYGKMPGYEQIFTDFLLGLVKSKNKRRLSNS